MRAKRMFFTVFVVSFLSTLSFTAKADYYVVTSWADEPCCAERYSVRYESCGSCRRGCDDCGDYFYYRESRAPVAFVGSREYAWVPFP